MPKRDGYWTSLVIHQVCFRLLLHLFLKIGLLGQNLTETCLDRMTAGQEQNVHHLALHAVFFSCFAGFKVTASSVKAHLAFAVAVTKGFRDSTELWSM